MGVRQASFQTFMRRIRSRRRLADDGAASEKATFGNVTLSRNSSSNSSTCAEHWELGAACVGGRPQQQPTSRGASPSSDDVDMTEAGPLEPCWILGSRYSFVSLLNMGTQGSVVKATDRHTGDFVAVKLIPRHAGLNAEELVNHRTVSGHPHIVSLRDVYLTPSHLAVVTDYADGGDLAEHLSVHVYMAGGGMPEASARLLFQQLVSALDWVHRCGIALRDVKCDNCLLAGAGATLKLADFGCSRADRQSGGCCADKICGTPEYLAPEVLLQHPGTSAQAADVWAAGVVLWALIGGSFPFLAIEEESMDRATRMRVMAPRIIAGSPRRLPQASPALTNLLQRMLEVDPAQRITIAELTTHPWVLKDMPAGLVGLNDRLAAAQAAAAAIQAWPAAPGCDIGGCQQGSLTAPVAAIGCDLVVGTYGLPSCLAADSSPRQGIAELRALGQRAAVPDGWQLQGGPDLAEFGRPAAPLVSFVPRYGPDARIAA